VALGSGRLVDVATKRKPSKGGGLRFSWSRTIVGVLLGDPRRPRRHAGDRARRLRGKRRPRPVASGETEPSALFSNLFSARSILVSAVTGEARELVEMLVGLASRAGWSGTARASKEGDGYVIALRVRRRPVELSERELRRRARAVRS